MVQRADESSDPADCLVGLLRSRASTSPSAELFTFLPDGDAGVVVRLTRGDLDRRARAVAARLQARGLAGQRALLVYPPGLEFISGFFGCLYAGVAAVPAYPPRTNRPMTRLLTIVEDARPAVALTCAALRADSVRWSAGIPGLAGVDVLFSDGEDGDEEAQAWVDPGGTSDTLALLQYTSGSTAAPKGVMISHGNLMANSARIGAVFGSASGERGVFWLPLFHDMGLIGGMLQTLYCGGASTLLPPASFLQRPIRWLEAISRTGARISGAPNFAYDLCVEKTTPEQRAGLDLSRWTVAFNGAEPIRAGTLERFAEAFAPSGFRREAFLACYGLAEATLLVSGGRSGRPPAVLAVDVEALGRGEIAAAADDRPVRHLVSSGPAIEGHEVAIIAPASEQACPDGWVGEIWVSGPSVARGYWGRPEESRRVMEARLAGHLGRTFLRTGDLGFVRDGELFVTGRIKDLIIVRGRNIYPQDVEWAAERSHPSLRTGGAAAFAVQRDGEDQLVIVIECGRRLGAGAADEILAAIRGGVAEALDVDLGAIRLIGPATLPRTSSGKVRRHACREAFLAGSLEPVAEWTRPDAAGSPDRGPEPRLADPPPAAAVRSRDAIAAWLAARVAGPLGLRPADIDTRGLLTGFGVGSLQAVRLAAELEEWLGRKLSPTLVYDYPTIDVLAAFLAGDTAGAAPASPGRPIGGREPIAIVGVGCRFPGARGPAAFWELLRGGIEAIRDVPDSRWDGLDLRGLDFPRRSGFVDGVDHFDAPFFGITRREAIYLDPQHRMLLEVAWEALEDAGLPADRLAGRPVGVFIGISTNDYALIQAGRGGAGIGHRVTGCSGGIAANRISHFFDFRGPSLAVDTACSSSLVAAYLACKSLWDGEADVALAGGSNLLLHPQISAGFARAGFLSPGGQCRAFDARADGYVRGEGAGLLVLKPLSQAVGDGDEIYAVIRGGAINQDGRTNGLTAPSGPSQGAVLLAAYRHAGISPGCVDYVEAHGTGTPLGDPIELGALGAVLADGRDAGRRCTVGSVKTNIGHLEAAAGAAGLIKAAMVLRHRAIPASLHFSRPNPHVDLDSLPLRIAAAFQPWPEGPEPARAGVSSFGFGGTNAHLVLEEAPRVGRRGAPPGPDSSGREDFLIPISARAPEALADLARSYRDFLATAPETLDLRDVAYAAGVRRAHLDHRLTLVVAGRDEAVAALDAFLRGVPHVSVVTGHRPPGPRLGPVFVFSDGSSIRRGAGRELWRREPAFRAAIERCETALGSSVAAELDAGGPSLDDDAGGGSTELRFAVQVALAELWISWGIAPGACVGEDVGQLAAAVVSGRLGLDDAGKALKSPGPQSHRLRDDLAGLAAVGHDIFVEIGARPGLTAAIRESVAGGRESRLVLSSLRGGDRGTETLRWSAAFLYAAGFDLDWGRIAPEGRFLRLPGYPWRHQRYWIDEDPAPDATAPVPAGVSGSDAGDRPLALHGTPPPRIESRPAAVDVLGELRERVAGLLGVAPEEVDVERPLLALGLDSITAMELKLELDASLGIKLPLSVLIEGSSIREVAGRVRESLAAAEVDRAGETAEVTVTAPVPASGPSHGQQMLWYAHQFSRTGAAYQVAGAGAVRGGLDLESFRRAVRRVIARHEVLRDTFPSVDEAPALRGIPPEVLAAREGDWLIFEDATGLDEEALSSRLTELVRRPFDLEVGPLFRVHLLEQTGGDQVVLLVFHHIIADFLSVAVFLDDLGRVYAEEQGRRAPTSPPMPMRYADFVRSQCEMLAGPEGERLWAYWRRQLDGPLPVLDLPNDRPRPAVRGDRGRTRHDALDPELTAALIAVTEANGTTLYTVLLAAFQVFLARYTGQDEVIVGSPAAGRTRPGLDGVVGYFVNMLPMRSSVADDPSFGEFLARVRRTVAEALEHQDFPFSLMVERLQDGPGPSQPPIFQVMYAHQGSQRLDELGLAPFALGVPGVRLDLHGLQVESVALDKQAALFELSLLTARDGDRLRLAWEYSTDLFSDGRIAQMASGFRRLLRAVATDLGRRLSDLPVLSQADGRRILEWWSVGPDVAPEEAAIHRLFEREAAAAPGAPALVFGDRSMSYGELNRLANVVARRLIERGAVPGSVVGLFLESWPLRLVGLLGVLKAGAAYMPLDPEHPTERLAVAFEDSGASILLADSPLRGRSGAIGRADTILLDSLVASAAGVDPGDLSPRARADDLAYIVFTSGTTGRPKGVMVSHRALVSVAAAWERVYDLRGGVRRHLQAAPFAFDVFAGDWIRALTTGGALVACPRPALLDPARLAELIRRHEIDAVELVPALAEPLAEHLESDGDATPLPLRLLAIGSDSLRSGLLRRLLRLLPPAARVVNSYGLTEAAIDSTFFDPAGEDDVFLRRDVPAPIGRPLPGVRASVLDRRLRPVPPGVVGELFIGGPGVARGYVGDPARTAERFVPDPFGPPGARMYATGDRARWRDGGVLELLGRADEQVKIRGVRVEPAEVEVALLRHPAVKQVAVVARADGQQGGARLAAYLVPARSGIVATAELRRWSRDRLPEAMVPSWFVAVDALPLSSNGKVDRAALPPPAGEVGVGTAEAYAAPRTPRETLLAGIAAELLGRDRVGIHDNFFDLGIDSILGIRLVSRARQASLAVDPVQLFKTPTIAGLAADMPDRDPPADRPAIATEPFSLRPGWAVRDELERTFAASGGVEDIYPLTPVQAGMLFHILAEPDAGHYVEQLTCRLRGALDLPALREAWRRLVARHPALRTTIHWNDSDRPYQVVHRRVDPPLAYQDWSGLDDAERRGWMDRMLAADRRTGFDLSSPPLSRLALIRVGHDLHRLIWSTHHVAVDGWCLAVLLHEALDTYEALRRGEEPSPASSRPFRDYVAWLLAQGDGDAEACWRRSLRGFNEATPLGLDGPVQDEPGEHPAAEAECETSLDRAVSSALRELARSRRLTLGTLVQGAWALLLGRYSGRADVVFGITLAGRPPGIAGVETMVGMFINTLPLRVAVDESSELVPWLRRLQGRLVEVRRHETIPLARVRGWSEIPPGRPLFESLVTVQNLPFVAELEERADRLGVEDARYIERTHYPITLTVLPAAAIRIRIAFDRRRFAPAAIDAMLGHFRALLRAMAEDPDRRLADMPWASDGEAGPPEDTWGGVPWELAIPDLGRLDEGELDALIDRLG